MELIDIEVLVIRYDDAEWVHPHYHKWEEVCSRMFRVSFRNKQKEVLDVFFNSFELTEMLQSSEIPETSIELISDIVAYTLVGDDWIMADPTDQSYSQLFCELPEAKVIQQFFKQAPIGVMELK